MYILRNRLNYFFNPVQPPNPPYYSNPSYYSGLESTYGFDKSFVKLIHSYLSNRKQRVKTNNRYSSWSEILFGVPQGSILGLCCSIFSYAICFTFLRTLILQITRTILHHIVRVKVPNFVVNNLEQS